MSISAFNSLRLPRSLSLLYCLTNNITLLIFKKALSGGKNNPQSPQLPAVAARSRRANPMIGHLKIAAKTLPASEEGIWSSILVVHFPDDGSAMD